MKKLVFIALVISGCSSPKEKQIPYTASDVTEDEMAVYEGKIITDKGLILDVELSLAQAAVGVDSRFKMMKSAQSGNGAYAMQVAGKYSTSYGLSQNEQGLTLTDHAKTFQGMAARGNNPTASNSVFEGMRTPELYFRTLGNEKLIQSDKNFNPKDSKYTLVKRSDLFTVEGYVTCQDSLTEFFERNTMRNWNVAPYGVIDSVKIKYLSLATESFEGVYLKALAYSIADTTAQGKKSLVVKRLIRMEKSNPRKPIQ